MGGHARRRDKFVILQLLIKLLSNLFSLCSDAATLCLCGVRKVRCSFYPTIQEYSVVVYSFVARGTERAVTDDGGVVVRERSRGRTPRPRAAAIFLFVYMSHSVRGG